MATRLNIGSAIRLSLISFFLCQIHTSWSYRSNSESAEGKLFRQYNEKCVLYDSSQSCDSAQGLMCFDTGLKGSRCQCPQNKLHAQYYDSKQRSCVGKAFNACVLGNARANFNKTLCVEHAECNTATFGLPICMCKEGYVENDDGTCVESLRYGDKCGEPDKSKEEQDEPVQSKSRSFVRPRFQDRPNLPRGSPRICDERLGLACIEGSCQCRFDEQDYNSAMGKCVGKVGSRCSYDEQVYPCVPNAHCPVALTSKKVKPHPFAPPSFPPLPPILDSFAGAGEPEEIYVMPLQPPHMPPFYTPHGHNHHHHRPPHPPMSRQDDDAVVFDTMRYLEYKKRSIKFGTNSNSKSKSGEDSIPENEEPKCRCDSGYSKTREGYCMKSYGTQCEPDDNLSTYLDRESREKNLTIYLDLEKSDKNSTQSSKKRKREVNSTREICNPDEHLECIDAHDGTFKCQCRNQMNERYDPVKRQCVAIIGRKCRSSGNYPKCEKGSECINGVCSCPVGSSLTPMETCLKEYEEMCEPGDCNVWQGLVCHAKPRTCLCLDSFLRWDYTRKQCVAPLGATCGTLISTTSWGPNQVPEKAVVQCEDGLECKAGENLDSKTAVVKRCQLK